MNVLRFAFAFPAVVLLLAFPGANIWAESPTPTRSPARQTGASRSVTGATATGGSAAGGSARAEGGSAVGGSATGGSAVGGSVSGGSAVGGSATGGSATGGSASGGSASSSASGGRATSGSVTPGTATAHVAGREITASAERSASVTGDGTSAKVRLDDHTLTIENNRLFLDGKERAKLPATSTKVQVGLIRGHVTVRADGTEVLSSAVTSE